MLAASENLPETNFREKVRCGEVYRNLNGNEMFQKFYYRCSECSMDFESSTEFEEHVIVHLLGETTSADNVKNNENIISISSGEDDDEEDNDYLYAFEVASLVEENVSENDLPLLMQMLGDPQTDICDKAAVQMDSKSDEENEKLDTFPCDGLRRQALHQYSEHCCTQCPAYFNTKSELIFHLHVHTLSNKVACPHCYEVFPNLPKLNEHLLTQKRKRKVNCEDNNIFVTESTQNSKKAKNQVQKQLLQIQDSEDNSRAHFTNMEDKIKESGSPILGNGETVEKTLMLPQVDVSKNDKKFCNDNNRKNHIPNDT